MSLYTKFRMLGPAAFLIAIAGFLTPVGAANAETTTTRAANTAVTVPGGGGQNRAFCRQITDSQGVIAAAKGDAVAKLSTTAKEWLKIEAEAPSEIKPQVVVVRTGFQTAAKAKSTAAVKAKPVVDAGKTITNYVEANCSQRPGGGGTALAEYRDCLEQNGVKLPAPGQGGGAGGGGAGGGGNGARRGGLGQLDPSDPKVQAAMKACQSKLPAGGGPGGGAGAGGGQAMRDCLARKKVTFTPGAGAGQPDAKTQKAIDACRAEALKTTTPTTKKK